MMRLKMFAGCVAVAFLVTFSGAAAADVIVPGVLAGSEGNSNNSIPFSNFAPSMRYQQVYAAAEFSGPLQITAIRFRPDADTGNAFLASLSSVQIDLSTTLAGPDGLSATFASNVGGDTLTVFSGPLTISSAFTGPVAGPKDFDILLTLSTPFSYNPGLGNLLMDVRNFSSVFTSQFDSEFTLGDSVSRALSMDVLNPTADFVDTMGLVTDFQSNPVPEPGSLVLLGAGLIGVARWRRGRKA